MRRVVSTSQSTGVESIVKSCKRSRLLTMQLHLMASSGSLEKALTEEREVGRTIPESKT